MTRRDCDCCTCDPTMRAAGAATADPWEPFTDNLTTLGQFANAQQAGPSTDGKCYVIVASMRFATERTARAYVGEGNYLESTVGELHWFTDFWVLFWNGSGYSRDDSRPCPLTIDYAELVTGSGMMLPTRIDLKNGTAIWERKSLDPASGDFVVFEQTFGPDISGLGVGHEFCVSLYTSASAQFWVTEGEPTPLEVEFTASGGTPPCGDCACEALDAATICIPPVLWGIWDGWGLSPMWFSNDEENPNAPTCDPPEFVVDRMAGAYFQGRVLVRVFGSCSATAAANTGCREDVREPPTVGEFTNEDATNDCDAELSTFTVNGDCVPDGGGGCPPEDCPVSYCKWQWDVDTQAWELISSNCIAPSECPGTPDDPADTEVTWVECACCATVTPGCTCDDPLVFQPCLTQDCTWIWLGTWDPLDPCSDITCECQGRPDDILDPGGFIGEIRDGCCCKEIV